MDGTGNPHGSAGFAYSVVRPGSDVRGWINPGGDPVLEKIWERIDAPCAVVARNGWKPMGHAWLQRFPMVRLRRQFENPGPITMDWGNVWWVPSMGVEPEYNHLREYLGRVIGCVARNYGIDVVATPLDRSDHQHKNLLEGVGFSRFRLGKHAHWRNAPGFEDERRILYAIDLRPEID